MKLTNLLIGLLILLSATQGNAGSDQQESLQRTLEKFEKKLNFSGIGLAAVCFGGLLYTSLFESSQKGQSDKSEEQKEIDNGKFGRNFSIILLLGAGFGLSTYYYSHRHEAIKRILKYS